MPDIRLELNQHIYEYDIQTLIMAFYPLSQVEILYEGEEAREASGDRALVCRAVFDEKGILFSAGSSSEYADLEGVTDAHDRKTRVKALVYRVLVRHTGRSLPWGNLTGIRPVKIVTGRLLEGQSEEAVRLGLVRDYAVSPQKAALAAEIGRRELDLMDRALGSRTDICRGRYSLYVAIPFCPSICLYCSFGSHALSQWGHRMEDYLGALARELVFVSDLMRDWTLDTVYIGGGTPTSLSPVQMDRLLTLIGNTFSLKEVKEWTVEAGRPDTITEDMLSAIRRHPVTRISINPQTMNQKTLDLIGRNHTVDQVEEAMAAARRLGFTNINMDLILGLPGEGEAEVEKTLEEIRRLRPDSLTVHSLALKRAARLSLFREEFAPISFENTGRIMQMTETCARELGMSPYYLYRQKNMAGNFENVGYSTPGKEGLYNVLIMEEKQTIMACGAGGSTKLVFEGGARVERVENVKSVEHYISRLDEMLDRKQAGWETFLQREKQAER